MTAPSSPPSSSSARKAAVAVVSLPFFSPFATCYPGVLIADRLNKLGLAARFVPAHVEFYSEFRAAGLTETDYKPYSHDSFAADVALLPLFSSRSESDYAPDLEDVARVYGLPGPGARRRLATLFGDYVDRLAGRLVAAEVVLSTATHYQLLPTLILARRLRELARSRGVAAPRLLVGGYLGDMRVARALLDAHPELDVVVYGEAEDALEQAVRLAYAGAREVVRGGARSFRSSLPSQRSLTEVSRRQAWLRERLVVSLELSRGCYWDQCDFCNFNASYDARFKMHSSEVVLDEIDALRDGTGQRKFQFLDTALPPRFAAAAARTRRDLDIFCEIRPDFGAANLEALAELGRVSVQIGIETLHNDHLAMMNKNQTVEAGLDMLRVARRLGIDCIWGIMVGHPKETPEIRDELLDLVKRHRAEGLPAPKYVTECDVRPGSGLWRELGELSLSMEFPWRTFDEVLPPIAEASALVPSRLRGLTNRGRAYTDYRASLASEVMAWQADQGLPVGVSGD